MRRSLFALSLLLMSLLLACQAVAPTPTPTPTPPPKPTATPTPTALPIEKHPEWPKDAVMSSFRAGVELAFPHVGRHLEKYVGIRFTMQPCASGTEQMNLLLTGRALLTFVVSYDGVVANNPDLAKGIYDEKLVGKVRSLVGGNPFHQHFLTLDPKLATLTDLKGKKIMYQSPGSFTYDAQDRCFEFYKMKPGTDFVALPKGSTGDMTQALLDGRADVGYLGVAEGSTQAAIIELNSKKPVSWVSFPKESVEYAMKLFPEGALYAGFILAKDYPNILTKDVPCISANRNYYSTTDMNDDLAYEIVKAMYGHGDELSSKPDCFFFDRAHAFLAPPPFHAGAVKYYKEVGWWNQEIEAKQQAALAKIKAAK